MCDTNESTFSADDIFLPFDVSFTPYFAGTSSEMIQQYMDIDDLDDIAALIWDLFEEFRIQDQIRRDRDGMGYFYKWESITDQLISELEQGDSIILRIKWGSVEKRNSIIADILNSNELKTFIRSFTKKTDAVLMHEWIPQFFVKDTEEKRYSAQIINNGQNIVISGSNAAEVFSTSSDEIELFASNRPYAEYQQKIALRQFRTGHIVNPAIQAACMNSGNIVRETVEDKDLVPFHNEKLSKNPSQKKAVELAFTEKNIFLFRGLLEQERLQ